MKTVVKLIAHSASIALFCYNVLPQSQLQSNFICLFVLEVIYLVTGHMWQKKLHTSNCWLLSKLHFASKTASSSSQSVKNQNSQHPNCTAERTATVLRKRSQRPLNVSIILYGGAWYWYRPEASGGQRKDSHPFSHLLTDNSKGKWARCRLSLHQLLTPTYKHYQVHGSPPPTTNWHRNKLPGSILLTEITTEGFRLKLVKANLFSEPHLFL